MLASGLILAILVVLTVRQGVAEAMCTTYMGCHHFIPRPNRIFTPHVCDMSGVILLTLSV